MEKQKRLDDLYSYVNHKKLRFGYTTGSCAAAAAKAALYTLLRKEMPASLALITPTGVLLQLEIAAHELKRDESGHLQSVMCGIRKDGGDDVDYTSGALICAEVSLLQEEERKPEGISTVSVSEDPSVVTGNLYDGRAAAGFEQRMGKVTAGAVREASDVCSDEMDHVYVEIDGGQGVGRVTKPGLDQPVGNAAINSVPRKMIRQAVLEVCRENGFQGGIKVLIFVPEGEEIAKKTFNANLGIVGGISILGTSGIVKPMSKEALIDSMRVEMNSLYQQGGRHLMISPGNYGEDFAKLLGIHDMKYFMQCSNYVGETMEMAEEIGVESILFVAHIGKFIKVAGGIMNTHSAHADARMEILAAAAIRSGADLQTARDILASNTTEDALSVLKNTNEELFMRCMDEVIKKIQYHLQRKSGGRIETGIILFSSQHGKLAMSENVTQMIQRLMK